MTKRRRTSRISDAELETDLLATRDANPGNSHTLYMKEAWLLIAPRRQAEGVATAKRAQQVWEVNRAKVRSPYGGSIFWEPWHIVVRRLGN